jgi:hypothetical protein
VDLANLGSESEETCVGSRVRLVGVSISFENNFYRLPFTAPSLVLRIGPSLPSVAQSEIVHAFLKGMTCRDLVHELGRSPLADSNELFDIATSFASVEEAVGVIFKNKKGKRTKDTPTEGSKSRAMQQRL